MSHKKQKAKSNFNIEKALLELHFPLKNNIGININLKIKNSSHSKIKHISKQYHGLTKDDIFSISDILKNPFYVVRDPTHREKKNYYGKRKSSKKILFIKIVTKVIDENNEDLITIFTTSHIKR